LKCHTKARRAKLSELDFVIPFRPEAAEFLSNYRKAPGAGKIPSRYIGRVPKERWTFPVFYTQWIGTSKVGLEWFCDSMKGWRLTNKKADEATEVVRAENRVIETFHMVDHEPKDNAPVTITFGLIATPTKPAPRGWEIFRTDELVQFPPTIGKVFDGSGTRVATQADVDAWKRRAIYGGAKLNTAFWPTWTGVAYFSDAVDHNPEVLKDIKWKFDLAHEIGMRVGPYTTWALSTKIPEWDLWGAELIKTPYEGSLYQTVYGCYNSPYTDLLVGNFVKNVKLVGLDGARHDTIAPQNACDSEVHGCAWWDEDGKKWPSQNLFATREFFKRMYRETHGGASKDGFHQLPGCRPADQRVRRLRGHPPHRRGQLRARADAEGGVSAGRGARAHGRAAVRVRDAEQPQGTAGTHERAHRRPDRRRSRAAIDGLGPAELIHPRVPDLRRPDAQHARHLGSLEVDRPRAHKPLAAVLGERRDIVPDGAEPRKRRQARAVRQLLLHPGPEGAADRHQLRTGTGHRRRETRSREARFRRRR
jgi:hypothetical protein